LFSVEHNVKHTRTYTRVHTHTHTYGKILLVQSSTARVHVLTATCTFPLHENSVRNITYTMSVSFISR